MHDLPGYPDVVAAAGRLAGHVLRTPLLRHPLLDERVGTAVLVKAEPLQRTGSFKLRGATNALRRLPPEARAGGVVAPSSGNHAQAIAYAAASLGIPALIAMPQDAPAIKVESTRRWGAEVVLYDRATTDRDALAQKLADERGATLIPPFEHPDVIAGQGTMALELIEDAHALGLELGALAICTGGGGLLAGSALALSGAEPGALLYAVEPEGWEDTARSLAAGERLANDGKGSPLCDSLMTMRPGAMTFAINQKHVHQAVTVTEAEIFAAMRFAFDHLKVVVEPGGAVALAAALAGKLPDRGSATGQGPDQGKALGLVLSGGNVDAAIFARALAAAPAEAPTGAAARNLSEVPAGA